jgi:hypothetical protein
MAKSIRMDSTTLAAVLAQISTSGKLDAVAASLGTGTQTLTIDNASAVEIFSGTFAGTAFTPSAVDFLPRTALASTSGAGGSVSAGFVVRIENGSGKYIEGEFGTATNEVFTLTKALDSTDTTYLTIKLGGASIGPPPATTINESMARVWLDPNNAVEDTASPARRNLLFSGHLAPNGPGINGRWDLTVSPANDPTPGRVDPADGKSKFLRVLNGSNYVYRTVMSKGQSLDFFKTHRLKFYSNFDAASTRIQYGEEVWIAYAMKTPSFIVGGGGADNGTNGVHFVISTDDSGDSNLYMHFARGNAVTWSARVNPVLNSVSRNDTYDRSIGSTTVPVSTWYHFVVKTKLSGVDVGNPYTTVWDKIGNGSIVQRGSIQGPNAWNRSAAWAFPDGGQYFFTRNFSATGAGDFTFETNTDPWSPPGSVTQAAAGTDMVFDYAGLFVVPVANAGNATHLDFFNLLMQRTGAS